MGFVEGVKLDTRELGGKNGFEGFEKFTLFLVFSPSNLCGFVRALGFLLFLV